MLLDKEGIKDPLSNIVLSDESSFDNRGIAYVKGAAFLRQLQVVLGD
jgi:hypothetical protein